MKIGITGNTSGLGKHLFDYYQSLGHTVVGFSRSNNNDISNVESIVSQSRDLDLFINNAYCGDSQARLLNQLANYPIDIISMGTSSTLFYEDKIDKSEGWKREYLINKKLLLDEHKSRMFSSKGNLLLLNLETLENHPTRDISVKFKEIHELIDFWLEHKQLSFIQYTLKD